ncbi:hypothetical protein ASPVEDRAFT_118678 [Aspergillus versicolor CBS 583.65]|uniref:Nuclear segregation protein Bfr1 n=1 Tax=Aspergillus versicolor CBS 583.65 TaxID=1036611 RepID=A0A1L9P5Z5_ASPVE|nr:uncharacterized protein ASPVEDRAFT_118678 [Aspergillus versicolor CBS 583.65]OJI96916.1 hypothetical protein ASPVEDRAFT_118678 [Aspergillus versicolor CBS 583.65]
MAAAVKSEVASEPKVRPTRPDEDTYKSNLAQAEKEHSAVQEKLNQVKAKIETAKPNNQDSPTAKKQQELRAELSSIRQKQQGFKASRTSTQEKINAIDSTLKARIAEQNNSRTRMSFKNVEEMDREISRLEKQVDSGTLRLVDEKKILADISSMRKQRKNFASLDDAQKVINDLKAQIATLKKTLDNPEAKALSDKYTEIQKELDAIKAEQDGVFKNLNALRDERTKLHSEQQTKWAAIREVKDNYYKARKAYKEYEDEAWKIRREKQKAQREAFDREKKRKVADKKLEEASRLAYTDEILVAQGLIRHFNPSYDFAPLGLTEKKEESPAFRAEVGRKVDDSGIKGMKVLKKDEDEYFVGTGGKKGKKGKKGSANGTPAAATPTETKFNMNVGIIEDFAKVKIDPPMNQSDVPAVVEKLAAKITEWKKDQASKTTENINKAKEEIARLDAEESAATETNGKTDEKDAAAETADDLQKASLEEKA